MQVLGPERWLRRLENMLCMWKIWVQSLALHCVQAPIGVTSNHSSTQNWEQLLNTSGKWLQNQSRYLFMKLKGRPGPLEGIDISTTGKVNRHLCPKDSVSCRNFTFVLQDEVNISHPVGELKRDYIGDKLGAPKANDPSYQK